MLRDLNTRRVMGAESVGESPGRVVLTGVAAGELKPRAVDERIVLLDDITRRMEAAARLVHEERRHCGQGSECQRHYVTCMSHAGGKLLWN